MLRYEIVTPENVRFELERAGMASRGAAWVLDVGVMGVLLELSHAATLWVGALHESVAATVWIVAAFLVQWSYGALCEWRLRGRTVGKWLVGISVVDAEGGQLRMRQAVVRNLLRALDWLPGLYLFGGGVALSDPNGRRLGDLAAGTVVVWDRRRSLRASRDTTSAARQVVELLSPAAPRLLSAERDAIVALCSEREELPVSLRAKLFRELAEHLLSRLALPWPAHISAESLILAFDTALRRRPRSRPVAELASQAPPGAAP